MSLVPRDGGATLCSSRILPGYPSHRFVHRLFRRASRAVRLFAAFSRFTRTTFLVYGIALLPFFWFNYWFVFVEPILNEWMALDFVSNAAMLALCTIGYVKSSAPTSA